MRLLFYGYSSAVVAYLILLFFGMIGWVMNIFAIVAAIHDPITTFLIIRIVGVFAAPLGAILGYL